MVKKENASTSLMLAKANMEAAALTGTAISKTNFTTVPGGRQPGVVEAILMREKACGTAHAIRTAVLVRMAGLSDTRSLQAEIEKERATGALILSRSGSPGGYFLPSDGQAGKHEIAAYVATLRARALNTLRTLKTAKRALRVLDGQEEIQ